jgi:ABC-2 type transport system ATP-binding protein
MAAEYAIQTEHLSKRFKQRAAVADLSLAVQRGEIFGFLGPNGSGKTTTIAMLLGLVQPTAGRALVLGHDMQQQPGPALQRVGAMVEAPAFFPYLSGANNLRVLARAAGLPAERVRAALAAVELEDRAGDAFRTYSQGMKQRLGIAAALLADPELIILDEPTNGLDPAGMVEVRSLIRSLAAGGRTIFLSSHLLHEVEQVCQRVAILKEGRLLAQGPVAELLRRGRGLQVRVEADASAVREVLQPLDWVGAVRQQNDMLLIEAPTERAAEINALLLRHDIPVAELRPREESLEEFFLSITHEQEGKKEDEAACST